MRRYLKKFPHAIRGLHYALRHDFGFRAQIYIAFITIVLVLVFLSPLQVTEFLFLSLAAVLVFITELQNSAIEAALDRLHPERHESIMRSKDMAAAAVLLAGCFALLVLVTVALF